MRVELVPITRVIPYARNPRRNEAAISKVAASIREFGFRQPIVVDDGMVVVVGHTRLEAARRLGFEEVPVHVAEGLTPAQLRAYRLADNRLHEDSEWDQKLLECELLELKDLDFDLGLTGFEPDEIERLLRDADFGLRLGADEDAAPELPAVAETEPGELILLGSHRLLCGDATSADDIALLLDGGRAQMVFTDPPYNVGYEPEKRPLGRVRRTLGTLLNDSMEPAAYADFLKESFACLRGALAEGGAVYVCHADQQALAVRQVFSEFFHLGSVLIWDKGHFSIGRSDYHWQHEPILYGWVTGVRHGWFGDRKQSTLWAFSRESGRDYVHPTQKPVALIERAIGNSSKVDDVVLDVFAGSGSTLIAAEKLGRHARLMELDPKYCDVIAKRWEEATGKPVERKKPHPAAIEPEATAGTA
jgi:DNA modification methylase